ncbi:MAG: hypothetical protein HY519_01185 [Candidatus Aenigmarchaeota archaeon]|nr:hypothetical protein [Candidatus Aenigmarchaeota archaeon]
MVKRNTCLIAFGAALILGVLASIAATSALQLPKVVLKWDVGEDGLFFTVVNNSRMAIDEVVFESCRAGRNCETRGWERMEVWDANILPGRSGSYHIGKPVDDVIGIRAVSGTERAEIVYVAQPVLRPDGGK